MGWTMPWYTITDSFDADFGVAEWHGHNAFIRDGERIYRTYWINSRGDEAMGTVWSYLDMTALGRQEIWEDFTGGLPAEPTLQVVELARQLRARGRAGSQMGRRVGRRRGSVSQPRCGRKTMITPGGASRIAAGEATTRGITKWLGLAATPTFAIMALMTSDLGGGTADFLCSASYGSQFDGMTAMYLLMGAFHAAPWLKLAGGWRS